MTLLEEIKIKSAELIKFSNTPLRDSKNWEKMLVKMDKQDKMMLELRELTQKANTILGRPFGIPRGDGYAQYVITKVNKTTVELTWISYGDDWVDPRVGKKGTYPLELVQETIYFENNW